MTGQEIIDWALEKCRENKRIAYDSAIVQMIRECHNIEDAVKRPPRRQRNG